MQNRVVKREDFLPENETLLQATGVIVTGFELLARGSLLGTAAGIVIFEAGRRYKKSKRK